MIAYHYPPIMHSSGVHRTAKFAQYLQNNNWQPIVLTVNPRTYPVYDENFDEIPGVIVKRSFALDTSRHLSIKGRYLKFMSLPDRWINWYFTGVRDGMALIFGYHLVDLPTCDNT